jgi:hypothetical protein
MKVVYLMAIMTAFSAFAQNQYIDQLTNPEYLDESPSTFNNNGSRSRTSVKIDQKHCDLETQERAKLNQLTYGTPAFETKLQRVLALSRLCRMSVNVDENGDLVEIQFENNSQNAINPRTSENGSNRQYRFIFEERSKQNIHLSITDDAGLTGLMSSDLLESTIVFIPRKNLPYVEPVQDSQSETCTRKIFLPTGEFMILNALTNEIIDGVLKEYPMDMTASRHQRKFAGLEYTGNGIMIRADRRAGTPEHTYTQSFNVNENISKAIITRKGKTCLVSKDLIWENTMNADVGAYFKYSTDQEFLDKVINPICGWGLSLSDLD